MRLTLREQEIINILKKNPLIAQDDLAQILGITRSSVAVHISNLMKKGIILGKGYVFNEQGSVAILGECFLEVIINQKESLNTSIDVNYCGVPIELSSIFRSFGIKPYVLTFIGNDEIGEQFLNQLEKLEVNISNIYKHPHKRTSRQVYINNELSFTENVIWEEYQKIISAREWALYNSDWLITEFKFAEEVYKRSLNKNEDELPYFCTYKLIEKVDEIPEFLSQYTLVVLGMDTMPDNRDFINKALALNIKPEQIIVITDGKSEIIVINRKENHSFTLLPNQKFSIYNNLSYFLAGLIYGALNNYALRQSIRMAIATTAFVSEPLNKIMQNNIS